MGGDPMKDYKKFIIKKNYHIGEIIAGRDVNGNKYFTVYKKKNNGEHFRYAISIGKKYGNAVQRNKIKRQIRHIIYQLSSEICPNYDIVIIVKPKANTLESYLMIEKQIKHVLTKAKILIRED